MSEPTIHLELTVTEVNQILEALGDQPFKSVFALVSRLQSQARGQLQSQEGAPAIAEPAPGSEAPA